MKHKSILQEAEQIVNGARRKDYGDPYDNCLMSTNLLNARFAPKLKEPLIPEEIAEIMILFKVARNAHSYKRDNAVDIAGYAWVLEKVNEGKTKRTNK
jgi:hypothetical protein